MPQRFFELKSVFLLFSEMDIGLDVHLVAARLRRRSNAHRPAHDGGAIPLQNGGVQTHAPMLGSELVAQREPETS